MAARLQLRDDTPQTLAAAKAAARRYAGDRDAAREVLAMLDLVVPVADDTLQEPPRPNLRSKWRPGTYVWRLLPSGTYLHAVRIDSGRRAASCSAEPAEGLEWRTPDAELIATSPCCRRCQRYLAPGGGARVV